MGQRYWPTFKFNVVLERMLNQKEAGF